MARRIFVGRPCHLFALKSIRKVAKMTSVITVSLDNMTMKLTRCKRRFSGTACPKGSAFHFPPRLDKLVYPLHKLRCQYLFDWAEYRALLRGNARGL